MIDIATIVVAYCNQTCVADRMSGPIQAVNAVRAAPTAAAAPSSPLDATWASGDEAISIMSMTP